MSYKPKVGDWVLYSSEYGLKIGIVRYFKKSSATTPNYNVDVIYTDDDRIVVSDILEVRSEVGEGRVASDAGERSEVEEARDLDAAAAKEKRNDKTEPRS